MDYLKEFFNSNRYIVLLTINAALITLIVFILPFYFRVWLIYSMVFIGYFLLILIRLGMHYQYCWKTKNYEYSMKRQTDYVLILPIIGALLATEYNHLRRIIIIIPLGGLVLIGAIHGFYLAFFIKKRSD